mgnify:CR=1 FL=1|tara:strand:+ start:1105 stop:1344 length:240 start_codon:yes stop_codon:yes gene_type:complete
MNNYRVKLRLPVIAVINLTAPSKKYIKDNLSQERLSRYIDDSGEYDSDIMDMEIQDESSYTDFRYPTVEEFNDSWGNLF